MVDPDPKDPYYLPDRDPKYGSGSRSEPKSLSLSKDKYRREGKGRGRRCCLGDIYILLIWYRSLCGMLIAY